MSHATAASKGSSDEIALHDEVTQLKTDFKQLRIDLKDDLRSLGHDIGSTASAGAALAKGKISDAVDAVVTEGKEDIKLVEKRIQTNPWTSVGIALGVGVLFGVLVGRR